jgi:hypothetical protein
MDVPDASPKSIFDAQPLMIATRTGLSLQIFNAKGKKISAGHFEKLEAWQIQYNAA